MQVAHQSQLFLIHSSTGKRSCIVCYLFCIKSQLTVDQLMEFGCDIYSEYLHTATNNANNKQPQPRYRPIVPIHYVDSRTSQVKNNFCSLSNSVTLVH